MNLSRRIASGLFALLVLAAIALRVFKAHQAGIIYDEALTWFAYASNLGNALTLYNSTNNHLLNSVAIWAAHAVFGGYEHFVRIPSVLAGSLFSLAFAYAVWRVVADPWLRLIVLWIGVLHYFVFDLSFLARGYAIGLAAAYAALAFVLWLETRAASRSRLWASVGVLALCNFLAVGAMLTSVLAMIAINAVCFWRFLARMPADRKLVAGAAACAFALTLASTAALYSQILPELSRRSTQFKGDVTPAAFFGFMIEGRVLPRVGNPVLMKTAPPAAALLAGLAVVGMAVLVSGIRRETGQRRVEKSIALAVMLGTLLDMLIYAVVLDRPLGHQRNHIFLFPMSFLAIGGALEALISLAGSRRILRGAAVLLVCLLAAPFAALNFPDPNHVSLNKWWRESNSGPSLRRLRARDPERVWVIKATAKHRFAIYAMHYYKQFGYRFREAQPDEEEFDLLLFDLPANFNE